MRKFVIGLGMASLMFFSCSFISHQFPGSHGTAFNVGEHPISYLVVAIMAMFFVSVWALRGKR